MKLGKVKGPRGVSRFMGEHERLLQGAQALATRLPSLGMAPDLAALPLDDLRGLCGIAAVVKALAVCGFVMRRTLAGVLIVARIPADRT